MANYGLNQNSQRNMLEQQAYEATMHYIKNLTKFGINLGLDRIKGLLKRLGNPQDRLRIIHIGGTNGKGSTSAILQAILEQMGYSVGMFISPHLNDYRERISINRELITPAEVTEGIEVIKPILEAMVADGVEHPTEFEVSTALALHYFALKQPDFVLLEVGLGGEIDSTNVVTPLISVITSIGMDHMDYLGNTLEEIANVKAGIIKEGVPVVTAADKKEAVTVIEQHASKKRCKLIKVGQDVKWQKSKTTEVKESVSQAFDYHGLMYNFLDLELSLLGEHQFTNASTALAVCEALESQNLIKLEEKSLREGLKKVRWPGRQELISEKPKILIDGAHNVDGMETLAKALSDYADHLYRRDRLVLCMGMLRDKEIEKAVNIIVPFADEVVITKPDSPRAGDWEYVARLAEKHLGIGKVQTIEDPVLAVKECLKKLKDSDMLCITGSLYMIAPVRQYLIEELGEQR